MHNYFASTYGSGAYDSSTYNGSTQSGSTASSAAGGTLTDTGIALASIVTLACLVLLVAVAVRIWKRPARQLATQPVMTSRNRVE